MSDLIYLAGIGLFFAVMAWFVRVCDGIIGPDPAGLERTQQPEPADEPVRPPAAADSATHERVEAPR